MWLELKSSVRRNTVTSLTSSPTLKGIKLSSVAMEEAIGPYGDDKNHFFPEQ